MAFKGFESRSYAKGISSLTGKRISDLESQMRGVQEWKKQVQGRLQV